jgi:hypothetical protein
MLFKDNLCLSYPFLTSAHPHILPNLLIMPYISGNLFIKTSLSSDEVAPRISPEQDHSQWDRNFRSYLSLYLLLSFFEVLDSTS